MNRTHARRGTLAVTATAAVLISTGLLSTGTAHADLSPDALRALTDTYLFRDSLGKFVATRAAQLHPNQLDWTSDSCSLSPNEPLGYEFTTSCNRHDFGYRNYKRQARFTEYGRTKVDNNFKTDMYSVCGEDVMCKTTAHVYYWAVREFGAVSNSTAEAIEQAHIAPSIGPSGKIVKLRATARNGQVLEFGIG